MQRNGWAAIAIVCGLAACADPDSIIATPHELHDRADARDAASIAHSLSTLPGITSVDATVRRPFVDPLAPVAASPGSTAAITLTIDTRITSAAAIDDATGIATAIVPTLAPANIHIVLASAAPLPKLAHVGPFTVEESSRKPLVATLAGALLVILALAGWTAFRERPRT